MQKTEYIPYGRPANDDTAPDGSVPVHSNTAPARRPFPKSGDNFETVAEFRTGQDLIDFQMTLEYIANADQ